MTREQFLADLKRALSGMSDTEKREILYDYAEHFRMGAADGKSEEQIARALGNPRLLGRSYRIDSLLEEPSDGGGVKAGSVVRAVFASVSLTFFNLIFILGPFLGLVGVMIGLWAVAVALPLSGVATVLASVLYGIAPFFRGYISLGGVNPAVLFFAGIGVAGLGLLSVLGMWKLSGLFIQMTAAYIRLNARVVTRRR
jgi:uncharacterized membrane protein